MDYDYGEKFYIGIILSVEKRQTFWEPRNLYFQLCIRVFTVDIYITLASPFVYGNIHRRDSAFGTYLENVVEVTERGNERVGNRILFHSPESLGRKLKK